MDPLDELLAEAGIPTGHPTRTLVERDGHRVVTEPTRLQVGDHDLTPLVRTYGGPIPPPVQLDPEGWTDWEREYRESLRRDLEHANQRARSALGAWARRQLPLDDQ